MRRLQSSEVVYFWALALAGRKSSPWSQSQRRLNRERNEETHEPLLNRRQERDKAAAGSDAGMTRPKGLVDAAGAAVLEDLVETLPLFSCAGRVKPSFQTASVEGLRREDKQS
jgi:hypothetical protein